MEMTSAIVDTMCRRTCAARGVAEAKETLSAETLCAAAPLRRRLQLPPYIPEEHEAEEGEVDEANHSYHQHASRDLGNQHEGHLRRSSQRRSSSSAREKPNNPTPLASFTRTEGAVCKASHQQHGDARREHVSEHGAKNAEVAFEKHHHKRVGGGVKRSEGLRLQLEEQTKALFQKETLLLQLPKLRLGTRLSAPRPFETLQLQALLLLHSLHLLTRLCQKLGKQATGRGRRGAVLPELNHPRGALFRRGHVEGQQTQAQSL